MTVPADVASNANNDLFDRATAHLTRGQSDLVAVMLLPMIADWIEEAEFAECLATAIDILPRAEAP